MITINLKPGAKRSKGGSSPVAAGLARVKGLGQQIKDPYRLGALVLGVAWLGFVGMSHVSTSAQLTDLEPKLEQARAEYQRFRSFLGEKRHLEAVRDSILAQVETIRTVDGDRYVWPHILDEVARAVPPFTWLTDIAFLTPAVAPVADSATGEPVVIPVQIQVTGRTVDIQGYTRLLRQLEDSPYLADVTAISANTVIEKERAVTAFVLKATFARQIQPDVLEAPPASGAPAAVARSGGE